MRWGRSNLVSGTGCPESSFRIEELLGSRVRSGDYFLAHRVQFEGLPFVVSGGETKCL